VSTQTTGATKGGDVPLLKPKVIKLREPHDLRGWQSGPTVPPVDGKDLKGLQSLPRCDLAVTSSKLCRLPRNWRCDHSLFRISSRRRPRKEPISLILGTVRPPAPFWRFDVGCTPYNCILRPQTPTWRLIPIRTQAGTSTHVAELRASQMSLLPACWVLVVVVRRGKSWRGTVRPLSGRQPCF